ncbi:MAG: hypothetical protein AB1349_09315 [Elusimicrobiota bacterium]
MKTRFFEVVVLSFVLFLVLTTSVLAETIYFKDGTVIKGSIKSTTEDKLEVKTSMGNLTVLKDDIKKIEYVKEKEMKNSTHQPLINIDKLQNSMLYNSVKKIQWV